ncbi:hypothetical protein FQR65_LT17004 [Abscondita terminalis]|nr:hypothetical protein FQR65_LT17004 [Abscondita terminalis]
MDNLVVMSRRASNGSKDNPVFICSGVIFDDNSPEQVNTGTLITKEEFRNAKAFNLKTSGGEILPRQGFFIHKQLPPSSLEGKRDLEIKAYSIDPATKQLRAEYTKLIPAEVYDYTVPRKYDTDPFMQQFWTETSIEEVHDIDIDGDGVSDLVFVLRDTNYWEDSAKQGDFNGDGIVDFLYFDSGGRPYLTTIKRDAYGFIPHIAAYSDMLIEGLRDDAVIGDFTGDGKTDLLVPHGVDNQSWRQNSLFYITKTKVIDSNGNVIFEKKNIDGHTLADRGLSYKWDWYPEEYDRVQSTEYTVETSSPGVKAIVPKKSVTKDFLKDITEESSVVYGGYYLPVRTETKVNGDFAATVTMMEYTHNPVGIGKDYFIGRPKSKTETVTAYGDTKSAKEEYTYENNLLKTRKTYNRDNSGWIQESYNYDGLGNITEKAVSNSADTMIQTKTRI